MIEFVATAFLLAAYTVYLGLLGLAKAIGRAHRFILPPKNVHTGKRLPRW